MPWNSVAPLGSVSVKANRTILGENTTYVQVTMGNSVVGTNTVTTRDHFWNVDSNLDGRHRFIQSVGFTSLAVAPNAVYPVLGAGMESVIFPLLTNDKVEWFHKNQNNNDNIYQFIPSQIKGTVSVTSTSTYVTVSAVPDNTYGEILMYASTQNENTAQRGYFVSRLGVVETWALVQKEQSDTITEHSIALKFGNGSQASGLDIRARRETGPSDTWTYIITYRTL